MNRNNFNTILKTTICIFLFPFFCSGNNLNCKDIREGTFKLENVDGSIYIIVRTKDKQTENVSKTGVVSQFDIKWISDCSYILFNRRVIKGKDKLPFNLKIDTIYNEITDIISDKHKVISSIKQYDLKVETTLIKIDTALLYRNIFALDRFKNYNGLNWGATLIGNNFSVAYRQNSNDKTDFLLAFEEVYTIDRKAQYKLLDNLNFKINKNQDITTSNCRFNDKYDDEIVAIYSSKKENNEAVIIKAWRLNRITMKIENVDKDKVKFKTTEEKEQD